MELLTYGGYVLTERAKGGYRSVIGSLELEFDTAAQWKKYIDRKNESRKEKDNHRQG